MSETTYESETVNVCRIGVALTGMPGEAIGWTTATIFGNALRAQFKKLDLLPSDGPLVFVPLFCAIVFSLSRDESTMEFARLAVMDALKDLSIERSCVVAVKPPGGKWKTTHGEKLLTKTFDQQFLKHEHFAACRLEMERIRNLILNPPHASRENPESK